MIMRSVRLMLAAMSLAVAAGRGTGNAPTSAPPAGHLVRRIRGGRVRGMGFPVQGGGQSRHRRRFGSQPGASMRRSPRGTLRAAAIAAAEMARELDSGRAALAVAAGWQPRADVIRQMDRVFVAYEALTAAKLALARGEPNAIDPQAAYEAAGGGRGLERDGRGHARGRSAGPSIRRPASAPADRDAVGRVRASRRPRAEPNRSRPRRGRHR